MYFSPFGPVIPGNDTKNDTDLSSDYNAEVINLHGDFWDCYVLNVSEVVTVTVILNLRFFRASVALVFYRAIACFPTHHN